MARRLGSGPFATELHDLLLVNVDECLTYLRDGRSDLPGSLHECRKRLKWLRAVLRGCRSGLGKRTFVQQDHLLRDAGRLLSPWRARSAQRAALEDVAAHFGLPEPEQVAVSSGLGADFLSTVERETAAPRRAATRLLERSRGDLAKWVDVPALPAVFARGMRAEWRRARRAYERSRRRPDAEVVHGWRKHVKYHLHQVQLVRREGQGFGRRVRELKALGEILGDAHDLAELRQVLVRAGACDTGGPRWDELLRAREAELTLNAFVCGAPLFAEFPAKLIDQVRSRR